jgi:hypothetical protein
VASSAGATPLTLWLPPTDALVWLAGGLLLLGAAVQAAGYVLGRAWALFLGAGLVLAAAWLDRDVTLAVGQILVAGLALPLTRERARRKK